MSVTVKAVIGTKKYCTQITAGNNSIITDEPIEIGGGNKGFNPYELLAASLASCTASTLRMYIDRKQWQIEQIFVTVSLGNNIQLPQATFTRNISFGNSIITTEQKEKLMKIATSCPVHKLLHNPIEIITNFE